MSEIISFFNALFDRFNKENGLSDVTYAMCKASDRFSHFFLSFMFPDEEIKGDGRWEREYQSQIIVNGKGSRIDFFYEENGDKYVIENKLFDQNAHEEYLEAFPDSEGYKRAFIANYEYNGEQYCHCATWKAFLTKLKE